MPKEVLKVVQFNNGVESCPVENYPMVGKDAHRLVESCPLQHYSLDFGCFKCCKIIGTTSGRPIYMVGIDAHSHVETCPV